MLPSRRLRAQPIVSGVAVVTLALGLAACGSQLDPDEVAAAGAGAGQVAGGGLASPEVLAGDDSDPGSTVEEESGGPGGSGGSSGSGGGAGEGSGSDVDGGEAPKGRGGNDATGGVEAAGCDGFQNGPGITADTITIGNASDISGPVPGLFEASQEATKAYVAYFNATSDICGRKLVLKTYDSRSDAAADQRAYADACDSTFAMVGSMSAFDSGGAATAEKCGLPDIRSTAVTGDRQTCDTCFGAQSTIAGEMNNAVPDYVMKNHPKAADNAAMLYINAGAAAENGPLQAKAMTKRGMRFTYVQGIDVSEFNYGPFVQQLKDREVRYVQMIGQPAQFTRLTDAMKQQSYKPDVLMFDPSAYDPDYVEGGGEGAEGTTVFMNFVPFEEASRNKETQLYLSWLQQVKPGAQPTFFGVFSWSAARLFVERATALGGDLSRQSLIASMRKVDDWTANGLHAPQRPGPKRTGECFRFVQLREGRWVPEAGTRYHCNGTTVVS